MRTKRIAASLLFLLSTSSYAMETSHISCQPIDASDRHVSTSATHEQAFSPLHRFLNDDFVSNLRFLCGEKQWNPSLSGHFQSILSMNFPTDLMTQFVHLLYPSPTGDYLVANQSTDIIAKTKASKFYAALAEMRTNGALDVWSLFELLFDRQLSSFAKEIIIAETNNFYIEQYANAVRKKAAQHQKPIDEVMKHLQDDDFFQDGFLDSKAGKLFKTALKGGNPARQKIHQALPQRRKNLTDTLRNQNLHSHKRTKMGAELAELAQLGDAFANKHDFQGYQIANAFVHALKQEQRGDYSVGTLERILATYMWQKAETIDDLSFLSGALLIDYDAMKDQVRPLIENPELLQSYYDAGRYEVIWAYIYRERLMLDAKHVPIIKYRTTTVDEHSIPDCFETAMHNAADFFGFLDGSFDPTIWKEGSELRHYFSEFRNTTPNDPRTRSKWATAVAKRKSVDKGKDVLYYTPSKKMNDVNNTIEAVPGIINMFKIMAHLGGATDATWEHIVQLETLPEASAEEHLSASFQLLMTDLTEGQIAFDRVNCSGVSKISDRIPGHTDFTGTFYVTIKNRLPFEWQFMHKHSIFKCDAPIQGHDKDVAHILAQLPLFTALKPHYTDLTTLITPEMTHQELTKLLMESDLRSPDLRREIMPILLESHLDLPLIKNIFKQIEKEGDHYEIKEIIKLFNKNINTWLDDSVRRPIVMDFLRSAPKLFTNEAGSQDNLEERALYRSLIERFEEKNNTGAWVLAIELMEKAPGLCFIWGGKDPIMPYVHFFKKAKGLHNIPLFNKSDELFDFTEFDKLKSVGF
ncbi:MAG: hypothetical protein V4544_04645 [Pseudomonadota bacterium]